MRALPRWPTVAPATCWTSPRCGGMAAQAAMVVPGGGGPAAAGRPAAAAGRSAPRAAEHAARSEPLPASTCVWQGNWTVGSEDLTAETSPPLANVPTALFSAPFKTSIPACNPAATFTSGAATPYLTFKARHGGMRGRQVWPCRTALLGAGLTCMMLHQADALASANHSRRFCCSPPPPTTRPRAAR